MNLSCTAQVAWKRLLTQRMELVSRPRLLTVKGPDSACLASSRFPSSQFPSTPSKRCQERLPAVGISVSITRVSRPHICSSSDPAILHTQNGCLDIPSPPPSVFILKSSRNMLATLVSSLPNTPLHQIVLHVHEPSSSEESLEEDLPQRTRFKSPLKVVAQGELGNSSLLAVFVGSLNQPQRPLREAMIGRQTTIFCDKRDVDRHRYCCGAPSPWWTIYCSMSSSNPLPQPPEKLQPWCNVLLKHPTSSLCKDLRQAVFPSVYIYPTHTVSCFY